MYDEVRIDKGGRPLPLLCSEAVHGRSMVLIAAVGRAPGADESDRGTRSAAPAMDRLPPERDLNSLTAPLPSRSVTRCVDTSEQAVDAESGRNGSARRHSAPS